MKWDCGLTEPERIALRKKLLQEQFIKESEWHPFFAMIPRRVGPRDCRWLEWIETRACDLWFCNGPIWSYEYRARTS